MRPLLYIALLAITLSSCGSLLPTFSESQKATRKELRKCDRVARKQERQLRRNMKRCPSMARTVRDTQMVAVTVPSINGTIFGIQIDAPRPIPIDGRIGIIEDTGHRPHPSHNSSLITHTSFEFTDDYLRATITFDQFLAIMGAAPPRMNYEVLPRNIEARAEVDTIIVQPPVLVPYPLAWWQVALMWIGGLTLFYLIIRIPIKVLP